MDDSWGEVANTCSQQLKLQPNKENYFQNLLYKSQRCNSHTTFLCQKKKNRNLTVSERKPEDTQRYFYFNFQPAFQFLNFRESISKLNKGEILILKKKKVSEFKKRKNFLKENEEI